MANELILIVEDNPKNLKLVRETLQVKGYQTIAASVMPHDRTRIMAAGFDGFQGKPISVKELLETIRQILERSGSRDVRGGGWHESVCR